MCVRSGEERQDVGLYASSTQVRGRRRRRQSILRKEKRDKVSLMPLDTVLSAYPKTDIQSALCIRIQTVMRSTGTSRAVAFEAQSQGDGAKSSNWSRHGAVESNGC